MIVSTWYQVEELIPAEQSFSHAAYWSVLNRDGHPWRCPEFEEALQVVRHLHATGRTVRLVKVTEEVVHPGESST